jgi:hypothetical protein
MHKRTPNPVIAVGMSEPGLGVLRLLHDSFGGSLTLMSQATEKWQARFRWIIGGSSAICLLQKTRPWLRVKAAQADVLLTAHAVDPDQWRSSIHREWSDARVAAFKAAKAKLLELNRKGPRNEPADFVAELVGSTWMERTTDLFGTRWAPFSGSWPTSGCMVDGRVYARPTWERRTDANGSFCWPTPGADSFRSRSGDRKEEQGLDQMARGMTWDRNEYPTPSATPYGTSQNEGQVPHARPTAGTPSLDTWAAKWPTPRATDPKSGTMPKLNTKEGENLTRSAAQWPTPTAGDAKASGAAGYAKASGAAGYSTESGRHEGTTLTDAAVGPRGRRDQKTPKAGSAGSLPAGPLPLWEDA